VVPRISLVIPAYNEARRIEASLRQLIAYAATHGPRQVEVIVVVEKSTDRTVDLARELLRGTSNVTLVENSTHRGKGYAVKTGMLRAGGDFVFFMDADLSTPLAEIDQFLQHAEVTPSVDVWIGNRRHALTEITRRQTLLRQSMGRTFNLFVKRWAIPEFPDTQCGFKMFRRQAVRAVFERQTIDGFSFDVEILLIAQRLGFQIRDLPVRWENSPETKVRIVRDSLHMLFDLIRVRRIVERSVPEAYPPRGEEPPR
jgi:dolichyl-phosphate beta-glucosyltransferase